MKRISILFLLLYASLSCVYAQNVHNKVPIREYYNSTPTVTSGYEKEFPLDNKGKIVLTLKVLSVEYSDSTDMSCQAHIHYLASLKGKGATFSLMKQEFEQTSSGLRGEAVYALEYGRTIQGNQEIDIDGFAYVKTSGPAIVYLSFEQGLLNKETIEVPFVKIPAYDNTEYQEKRYAAVIAREKQREEAERREAENRARMESSRAESKERQDLLLTPDYLANWVGAGFFTKKSIEHDCGVSPIAYNGGAVMYDFSKCPVTMVFDDESEVCIQLSFRLFGEDGYQMKRALIDYGYKVQSKSTGDLIAENNFENLQRGTTTIYKCKLNAGDYSTCELIEGQAMMFTFYRTRK